MYPDQTNAYRGALSVIRHANASHEALRDACDVLEKRLVAGEPTPLQPCPEEPPLQTEVRQMLQVMVRLAGSLSG